MHRNRVISLPKLTQKLLIQASPNFTSIISSLLHYVYIATLDIYNKTQSSEFLNHENHISTRNPIY